MTFALRESPESSKLFRNNNLLLFHKLPAPFPRGQQARSVGVSYAAYPPRET